jgi:hypothetical protein
MVRTMTPRRQVFRPTRLPGFTVFDHDLDADGRYAQLPAACLVDGLADLGAARISH